MKREILQSTKPANVRAHIVEMLSLGPATWDEIIASFNYQHRIPSIGRRLGDLEIQGLVKYCPRSKTFSLNEGAK